MLFLNLRSLFFEKEYSKYSGFCPEILSIYLSFTLSFDEITFSYKGEFITHRVVGSEKREDGKYYFRTKGDANIVEDPIVTEDQLYGVVVYRSAILSLVYRIVGTKVGFYLFIIIPILFIIGSGLIFIFFLLLLA